MLPISEFILLVLVPVALMAAAGWDLASYTIPNLIPVCLLACFAIFVLTTGMPAASIGTHVLAGALGLAVGFTLFALGYTGGGDAKLFATIALWLGLTDFLFEFAFPRSLQCDARKRRFDIDGDVYGGTRGFVLQRGAFPRGYG